jgi:H+/Na+-translocating ferredoxin:NAD+ oxidoreductase subunit G
MKEMSRSALLSASNLLVFTVIGTAILAFAYGQTKGPIAQSEAREKLRLISQILPRDLYDNQVVHDTLKLKPDNLLGTTDDSVVYRARLHGKPTAAVLEAIAPEGYGGDINLLVAIRTSGEILGVRVVSDNETPGLGDYIEIAKSKWIKNFDGASQQRYNDDDWQVKKDGGKFDYMAGATISPRAVVKAVHHALQYFAQHRKELFAAAPAPVPRQGGKL